MASRAKQRWIVGILVAVTLGIVTTALPLAKPYVKAYVYDHRIREDIRREATFWSLGRMGHPAAIPYLERYLREPLFRGQAEEAARCLYLYYPQSPFARAAREYEQIAGRRYYSGFYPYSLEHEKPPPRETLTPLRQWVSRYRGHPGTDDVLFRIARILERDDPVEALRTLHEAFHSPDRDKKQLIANWFQRTLERAASVEDLERWLETDCPEHVADNVHYVAGLKHMRRHRFEEAMRHFDASRAMRQPDGPEMAGWWRDGGRRAWRLPEKRLDRYTAIDEQILACSWYLEKEVELRSTLGPESRGALLHEMGRRCFRGRYDFSNRLYYPVLYRERPGERIGARPRERKAPFTVEDLHLGNNYRQAMGYFRRLVRECSGYSRLEAVEYSIPLCLWRVRRSWPVSTSLRYHFALYQGFQDFADKYPCSTLTDEALYLAGIHHWILTRENNVIFANLNRILVEHPHGNVASEYARQIHFRVYGDTENPEWVREAWSRPEETKPEKPRGSPGLPEPDLAVLGLSDGSGVDPAVFVEVEPADALESGEGLPAEAEVSGASP